MKLERIDYIWGMFANPSRAAASRAKVRVSLSGDEIPGEVRTAFAVEDIGDLRGDFGQRGVGSPEEVSVLDYTIDGEQHQLRVFNHGISMLHATTPELARLLRFFVQLRRIADQRDSDGS